MIFFTADLHLGHENVIRHCNRPFASAEIMDRELIANWNHRVRRDDTVYIAGDFCFRNKRPVEEYLSALNGHKHLIIGNHDHSWLKKGASTPITLPHDDMARSRARWTDGLRAYPQ